MEHYDFCGYATKNDIRCADGRTIRKGAFLENDGKVVPLVWMHQHNEPANILGHALLENRDDGVYAYCAFNNSAQAQDAKIRVMHGDINQMSIYANQLRQTSYGDVMHGVIREVSLVVSGANPGAYIEALDIRHSDDPEYDEEYAATLYTGECITLMHASPDEKEEELNAPSAQPDDETNDTEEEPEMATNTNKTVEDVFNEFTEEQKNVVYFLIGEAIKGAEQSDDDDDDDDELDEEVEHGYYDYNEEDYIMHANVFENLAEQEFLAHADAFFEDTDAIFKDAKRLGSLKDSVIEHAATYGIDNIDYLFPDARTLTNQPEFIRRSADWVNDFMDKVHKSPFSRIKSVFADITEAEARARGYIKGKQKKEEVFSLLKRTTTPTTVYKKQKLDRDDVLDITDFDVIAWMKQEMRWMLDEEVARAALIGDGRSASSDDKIDETKIRPIWTDADLFTIKATVTESSAWSTSEDARAKDLIRAIVKARKDYKGSGNPIFFTTEDVLTDMLLVEDGVGRPLYDTVDKLATKLRVSKIVTVEVMENQTRTDSDDNKTHTLVGIIVNPADYNFGSDKGGEIALFDDFDIDYNQQKYLIETRLSGALTKPKSAIAVETIPVSGELSK